MFSYFSTLTFKYMYIIPNKKNKTKLLKKSWRNSKKINEYILKNGDLFEVYANKKKLLN